MASLGAGAARADEAPVTHPARCMAAVPVNPHAPRIDGRLDDAVWQHAPRTTDFLQREPDEGQPATQQTAVQVVYDAEALYVGITCYDAAADSIVSRLTRRDQWAERDWVEVALDPHHDHQNGYWFMVASSGSLMDGILTNDDWWDDTWDGVWEGRAAVQDSGWCAEYRIPFHVLRFAAADEQVWGVNVMRYLARRLERSDWVMVPRGQSGCVSRFGHLEGLRHIAPSSALEVAPFVLGRSATGDGDRGLGSAGVDMRYGLTSSISLNATANPDFGQVEADPAVLNLSVFETFLQERRPFFLEGNAIFQQPGPDIPGIRGPAQLFYSRRIGRQPGRFDLPEGADEVDRPDATTILGAVKLSGKTAGRTSFGVLEAVTAPEDARIEETAPADSGGAATTRQRTFRVEPLTSYLVGRVQQDVRTHSAVGATWTAVNGRGFGPRYVGSVDGTLKWKDNACRIFTRLSASSAAADDGRDAGYEAVTYFSKFSGNVGGQLYVDARSPGFQANDLGYMDRPDRIQAGAHVYLEINKPWVLARHSGFNLNAWHQWNYDGVELARGVNFNTWHDLRGGGGWHLGINRWFAARSDLETRGGPLLQQPPRTDGWAGIGMDERRMLSGWVHVEAGRQDGGRTGTLGVWTGLTLRPASNVSFELGPSYQLTRSQAQWVDNVDDNGDDVDDHFVFARLHSQVLDLTLRGEVAFTTTLTLQGYTQSFVTAGDYSDFRELARPSSYAFTPYAYAGGNPDFSSRSLRGNLVLRWEYRPGSALFVVWSRTRSFAPDDVDAPRFEPLSSVRRSLTGAGDDTLLLKATYWLGA